MTSWPHPSITKAVVVTGVLGVTLVSALSLLVYFARSQALERQQLAKLEATADLRQHQVEHWLQRQRLQIRGQIEDARLHAAALALLQQPRQRRHQQLLSAPFQTLDLLFASSSYSRRLTSVLSNGGIVLYSTDHVRVGRYQPLTNSATFLDHAELATAPFNLYTDATTGLPTITAALPIEAEHHNSSSRPSRRRGVLAVTLDLQELERMVSSSHTHKQPYRVWLVGYTGLRTATTLSPQRVNDSDKLSLKALRSKGILHALDGFSGRSNYLNDQRLPVVGVYRWIAPLNLALLVESQQSHTYGPARREARLVFLVGNLLVLLLVWMVAISPRASCAASKRSSRGSAAAG
jgi:hypothetical protein